jgi:hypothetical protein
MRRRALTLGLLLILVAIFLLQQGPALLTPAADLAGLSTHYTRENAVLPPTLYRVPAENYTFISADLTGGSELSGSLQVADDRQVAFYVMNEGNFSLWRDGRPASLAAANLMATAYNFTFTPPSSGSYYFVFDNQDNSPVTVIFGVSTLQGVTVLSPFVEYAWLELLVVGVLFTFFGARGGGRKKEAHRDSGWKCKFCGVKNVSGTTFCAKCSRARS